MRRSGSLRLVVKRRSTLDTYVSMAPPGGHLSLYRRFRSCVSASRFGQWNVATRRNPPGRLGGYRNGTRRGDRETLNSIHEPW
jgi:hypothetical protein